MAKKAAGACHGHVTLFATIHAEISNLIGVTLSYCPP